MNYSTFDRFAGAWWGSAIAGALSQDLNFGDRTKILRYKNPDWIATRNKIGQIIVKDGRLDRIDSQLVELLSDDATSVSIDPIDLPYRLMSLLLPIILFAEDNKYICKGIITQCHFKSDQTSQLKEYLLIWSYILTLVLNNKFQFKEPNVSKSIDLLLGGGEIKTTSLVEKLEMVSQAWSNGLSLRQLSDQLRQPINKDRDEVETASIAIALSWFCFASTPRNFMLSVKRASHINSRLSVPTAILTATISGAYNGVAGIPRSWRETSNSDRVEEETKNTIKQLFQTWLGIHHSLESKDLFCNPEIHAVAMPKIIQPRQNLKIISQK
ncbi:hypothetical protein I4641_13540 [Waterburya agarophytonicola K14]|uniref:ADP-ribosylglycohydrolase family protein n=1 Tax=Waterburya agarophytonicola KI4 TaxID=2874699 RepID=A0A964FGA7_9CYAN|nr:hypothetical protein [Waterburya agarophytonicola]MCC0178002.1 hypothetical protein [Waterburya agarophytonicola KI4]